MLIVRCLSENFQTGILIVWFAVCGLVGVWGDKNIQLKQRVEGWR